MASLVEAHIEAEQRLRDLVVAAVERIWRSLTGWDNANLDEWLTQVVPVVLAGQRQSVSLTEAYLARAIERPVVGLDPAELIGSAVRNGTAPEEVYKRPMVRLWAGLGDGKQWQDAFDAGLAQAKASAAIDPQLSMRATADAVQRREGFFGFRRRADAGACEFCRAVDGAYVKSAGAFALHNRCGCGLEPLANIHPDAVLLPDGTRIRDHRGGELISSPAPDTVAIHDHGELGPMLADPADNFTTQAELH